jgi:hypothetical protein
VGELYGIFPYIPWCYPEFFRIELFDEIFDLIDVNDLTFRKL